MEVGVGTDFQSEVFATGRVVRLSQLDHALYPGQILVLSRPTQSADTMATVTRLYTNNWPRLRVPGKEAVIKSGRVGPVDSS